MVKFFKKYSRLIIFTFSIAISLLAFVFRNSLVGFQGYGLFGLFIISLLGSATILVPVPVFAAAFIAGAVFNPFLVAIVVSIASAIGEMTGYMAGYGAEDIIEHEVKLQNVKRWMDKYGLWTILFLAAIPNPVFDLAGIVAGATGISVKKFLTFVWVGKLIKFGVIAYLGSRSILLIDRFI